MKNAEASITIRKFRETDIGGVMNVLADAAYSHIWPGFLFTIKKKSFKMSSLLLATGLYLYTWSEWMFIYSIVACCCMAYAFHWVVALYYLYGPPLSDMKYVMQSYFADKNSCFWIAESINVDKTPEIVGTIAILSKRCEANVCTEAWLRRMAVHRKFRGKGIAGRLIETAIEFCLKCNYQKISLITTDVHVQARQLYKKYGFVCTNYKPIFYLSGLFPIWTFEFEKRL